MIKKGLLLSILCLIVCFPYLHAQEGGSNIVKPEDRTSIQDSWNRTQPIIMVFTESGDQYAGQPIHASMDTLYLFPATGFPVGSEWYSKVHRLSYSDIDHVLLQKGGNLISRSNHSVRLQIPKSDKFFTPQFQALRQASVYNDSMVRPQDLEEALDYSRVLRQTFPAKRLRITVGLGFGVSSLEEDVKEAIHHSSLPAPRDSWTSLGAIDLVDISWRFLGRIVVGGQASVRNDYSDAYGYYSTPDQEYGFDYSVRFREHRLYVEYAFLHIDRFFSRRVELLAGAGYLMGRPEWSIYYHYNKMIAPDDWIYGDAHDAQQNNLQGAQLRAAFHYYLFPGLSMWTGAEANFYKPWTVEAVELPTSDPAVPITIVEHTLDFSSIRFKFGVSIYL